MQYIIIIYFKITDIEQSSCTAKWPKVGQILSITLTKVYGIPWRFPQSQTFGFNKISSCFVLFMTEIFRFMKILQLPNIILFCSSICSISFMTKFKGWIKYELKPKPNYKIFNIAIPYFHLSPQSFINFYEKKYFFLCFIHFFLYLRRLSRVT